MHKTWLFTLILLLLCNVSFGQSKPAAPGKPFVIGVIDTIKSSVLSENRVLNVYLPDGYSPDSATTYPVIYVLDGSADEDFIHIVGLVQYFNFPWINQFPPSIVVGIANVNRKRDFTFPVANLDFMAKYGFDKKNFTAYGGSEKFMTYIEKEVQPYVDKHFKSNASRTIIGQSLGGLLATEILLKRPKMFDTYIIMSPSLWWGSESLLQQAPELLKAHPDWKTKVYVGVGREGNTMVGDAKKLARMLRQQNNIKTSFDYLPRETHATMTHQAVYNAFKLLYPAK